MKLTSSGALSALLGLAILITGCEEPMLGEVPTEILGRWTTTDPRYADRAFEITRERVYLHQGGDEFALYAVLGFRIIVSEDDAPIYSVVYRDDAAEEYSFRFYLSHEGGDAIRFTNQQEMVWSRDPDAPVPWDALERNR
ncbi:MAG: hypothetical protein V3T24_13100 [Longimicrobiales bacterium]